MSPAMMRMTMQAVNQARASVRPGILLQDARRGISNSRSVCKNAAKPEKLDPLPPPIDAGSNSALAVCGGAVLTIVGYTIYTYRTA